MPSSRPHGTGRHHPQLEGGEVVPQKYWVTSWSEALGSGAVAYPPPAPTPPHNSFVSISLVVSGPGLLVPAGPRLETACLLFALRGLACPLPNALRFFWSRGGKESSPVWPQGVAGIQKEAGSQTLIMLSLVYVQ